MVSSGGGDPPCTSSGVSSWATTGVRTASRFPGGLRLVALARPAVGRRFDAFAVVRRFEVVRRFAGVRFFRVERVVAARFLRFAICCLLSRASLYHFLPKKER
jgi:hypothetical protein